VQGNDGNFYGTAGYGGSGDAGTIFEFTASGTLTTLYEFNGTAGANPAGIVQSTDGNFYGATTEGGSHSEGVVYRLSLGLGPFVKTLPTANKIGGVVKILGSGLTGATSVSFNGTAAAFTVVSPAEISTTVPAGATTGTVEVTTPSGTLKSNPAFEVCRNQCG
jgi:uncharacterized repeat protein (TIGR03803 family)